MWNYRIVAVAKVTASENTGGVGGDRLAHDHRRAAPGTLGVVAQVAFAGQPALRHVGRVGTEIEAMLEGLVAQVEGLEKMGKQL